MRTSLLLRYMSLVLGAWLMLAGVCFAKQVYQKDGGIIECESFWKRGDVVVVKINRDVVIELAASEIDLKRTFPKARKKPAHPRRGKTAHSAVRSLAEAPAAEASTTPDTAAPPASTPAPGAKVAPPPALTPVPAPKAAAQPDPAAPATTVSFSQEQRALTAATGGKYLLLLLAVSVIIMASLWIVFKKAGRSGVASIVPFYNMYVLLEISGKPGWWLVLLMIPGAGFVFQLLAMLGLAQKFGRSSLFGVGLFFLPMFFFPMLGFGKSQYEGQGAAAQLGEVA